MHYVLGTGGSFAWSNPGGPDDNIVTYLVDIGTTVGGSDLVDDAMVTVGETLAEPRGEPRDEVVERRRLGRARGTLCRGDLARLAGNPSRRRRQFQRS